MKKVLLSTAALALGFLTACEPAANTGNKPANAPANNASTAAPVNAAAVETDIKKMVGDVYMALAKNDADALEKYYADTYMLVDLDGSVKTKAARFAELKSGDVKFESVAADEISVRSNPEGTGAVSIARVNAKSVSKGMVSEGPVRVTTVWSKTKDGWKAVSAHATRIAPSAPASNTAANTPNANTSGGSTKPVAPANK